KDAYRIRRSDPEFDRWWTTVGPLTEQEKAMAYLIAEDYRHAMDEEQWAWWRKQLMSRSETNLLQEHPWHERVAFQVTGSPFFSPRRLAPDVEMVKSGAVTFNGYRYHVGDTFLTMRCEQVQAAADAELRIWEGPVKNAR